MLIQSSAQSYGYMLARDPKTRGRAWQRTGVTDSLSTQKRIVHAAYGNQENYGGLPAELDTPEVFDDWSGGYGQYRRHHEVDTNHYHLAYNTDTRFPGMWYHAQAPQLLCVQLNGSAVGGAYASAAVNADYFMDVPLPGVANPPAGAGSVLVAGLGYVAHFTPTKYQYQYGGSAVNRGNASTFDFAVEATGGGIGFGHRMQVFGSYSYIPNLNGSGFYQRGHDGTT